AWTAVSAASIGGTPPETSVPVYMTQSANIPWTSQNLAQAIASKMFRAARVRLEWRAGVAPAIVEPLAITVELKRNVPKEIEPGSLARALPFSDRARIEVFYDRIEVSQVHTHLLAHVLVHEIAHVLEGGDWHAES